MTPRPPWPLLRSCVMQDINNILNSGEVPNMFTQEEKDKKINACIEAAREAKIGGSRDAIYNFFISRVRDNLHIVLCMSPVGDAFRRRYVPVPLSLPMAVSLCTPNGTDTHCLDRGRAPLPCTPSTHTPSNLTGAVPDSATQCGCRCTFPM